MSTFIQIKLCYSQRVCFPGFVAGNLVGDGPGGGEGGEESSEEIPLQVPEPNAELLTQLGDMGFPEGLAKKALLLSRNRFEVAVEYCLTQGDDAHANDPPTEAQLRRVYGRNPAARARFNMQQPEPDAALVQQLTDMGFPPDQVRHPMVLTTWFTRAP